VYEPAESPVAEDPVPPVGDHEYEYEGVPPLTVTEADPFDELQVAGIAEGVKTIGAG